MRSQDRVGVVLLGVAIVSKVADVDEVILFVARSSPGRLDLGVIESLVFLADAEHRRAQGSPLVEIEWSEGPFSNEVLNSVRALIRQGRLHGEDYLIYADAAEVHRDDVSLLPEQQMVLRSVVERFAHLARHEVKEVANRLHARYRRELQRSANGAVRPRRPLIAEHPRIAALLARAPKPDTRDWGSPDESEADDEAIMREFAGLRREANRDID